MRCGRAGGRQPGNQAVGQVKLSPDRAAVPCIANNTGKSGKTYPYFICLGRQRDKTSCNQRAIPIPQAVSAVEACYGELELAPDKRIELQGAVFDMFEQRQVAAAAERTLQERSLRRLTDERQMLLRLYYDDAMPTDLLRVEMDRIQRELDVAQARLDAASAEVADVTKSFEDALELATDCERFYRDAARAQRRMMNQALFKQLFLKWDEDGEVCVGEAAAVDLFTTFVRP